jgi:hypothetical protein
LKKQIKPIAPSDSIHLSAAAIAGALVKLIPEHSFTWVCRAYATRRKSGGGIPEARQILALA